MQNPLKTQQQQKLEQVNEFSKVQDTKSAYKISGISRHKNLKRELRK